MDGLTFESACTALKGIIGREAMRFQFLKQSGQLSQEEKEIYQQLIRIDESFPDPNPVWECPENKSEQLDHKIQHRIRNRIQRHPG